MNITINIQAPELAKAIETLAAAIAGNKETLFEQITNQGVAAIAQQSATQQAPTATYHAEQPVSQPVVPSNVVPLQQPVPTYQAPPVQAPPVQQPQAVPTSAPAYTMDQLAVAATQLMDAGRQPELLNLLQTFGVPSLMALPKEQYGAFATKLREMGARI